MKTKLALAITALALNAQAVTINISHHDYNKLVFDIRNTDVLGGDRVTQVTGNIPYVTYADVSAFAMPGRVVAISVNWQAGNLNVTDSFASAPFRLTFPDFEGSSYQLLEPHVWQWTYTRPGAPIDTSVIPDNGSVLAALGAALLGVWRLKR